MNFSITGILFSFLGQYYRRVCVCIHITPSLVPVNHILEHISIQYSLYTALPLVVQLRLLLRRLYQPVRCLLVALAMDGLLGAVVLLGPGARLEGVDTMGGSEETKTIFVTSLEIC